MLQAVGAQGGYPQRQVISTEEIAKRLGIGRASVYTALA
jgi:biotin operon repressor